MKWRKNQIQETETVTTHLITGGLTNMKKSIYRLSAVVLTALLLCMSLAGCSGGSDKKESSAEASSTAEETNEDDELLKEMSGKYDCVEVRRGGKEEEPGGETLQMYEDYEAMVSLTGEAERFKVETDRSGFVLTGELDGEKAKLSCTYRNGVIHLETDDAEYVFAKKNTDRWKEWDAAKNSEDSENSVDSDKSADSGKSTDSKKSAEDGMAGYYPASRMYDDEMELPAEMIEMVGMEMYIVLEEGGAGYIVIGDGTETQVTDFEWDEKTKSFSAEDESLDSNMKYEDGMITFEFEGTMVEFSKSDEPAPKKPKATTDVYGTGDASGTEVPGDSVNVVNSTFMTLTGGYFADTNAPSWDTESPDLGMLDYGEEALVIIEGFGGPGVYDILFVDDTDWKYTFYGVTISGGETINFANVEISSETCTLTVTDADGNTQDYEGQAILPE